MHKWHKNGMTSPMHVRNRFSVKAAKRSFLGAGLGCVLAVLISVSSAHGAGARDPAFATWLDGLRVEARKLGVSDATFDAALGAVEPITRVIELDRKQPEFTLTFWKYLDGRVTDKRVERGRALLAQHRDLLERVAAKYGVQPQFLVAFWGLESNFGDYTGVFPVAGAVATLAYDERRAKFFRAQLLAALELMERGDISHDQKGSWAGAMGNTQFIPTTYRDFAVDFDGDNKRDLWGSLPDVFASSANYLSRSGWKAGQRWGREVRLPEGFDYALASDKIRKTPTEWAALGLTTGSGSPLPKDEDIKASVVLPAGYNGPAFLAYQNYRSILIWNRSHLYAIAVGHLADRISGMGRFAAKRPANEQPLSREDIKEIQKRLQALGFDPGGTDGVIGPMTRSAIRNFQKGAKLPPDGYADFGLLERLRGIN